MNKNKILSLLLALIFVIACSPYTSSVPSIEIDKIKTPDWYLNPPKDLNHIYGTATATSKDIQRAIDKATDAAKLEIAMSMEVNMEGQFESILEEVVINNEIKSRSIVRDAIKASTDVVLQRVTVVDKVVFEADGIYRAYVLLRMTVIPRQSFLDHVYSQILNRGKLQDSLSEKPLKDNIEHDSQWFNGRGVVTLANITPEEAYQRALDLARNDALSKAGEEIIGLSSRLIQEGTSNDAYDQFIQFTQRITRGKILEEVIIKNGIELQQISNTGVTRSNYVVEINARVSPEIGKSDPDFNMEISLNKSVYSSGELLYVELTASKDCYVTIFNLHSNDSLQVVYPNYINKDNRLYSGSARIIPSKDDSWKITVRIANERNIDQESLFVVGTKEKNPFSRAGNGLGNELISTGEALIAINKWLITIEKNNRTQAMVSYTIVR